MAYETRDNTGALFRNDRKEKDTHPDYTGTCMVNGCEMFFDAWLKTSESGRKWMSFSFKAKQKQDKPTGKPVRGGRVVDDEIPS